jgi:hypothetical protein
MRTTVPGVCCMCTTVLYVCCMCTPVPGVLHQCRPHLELFEPQVQGVCGRQPRQQPPLVAQVIHYELITKLGALRRVADRDGSANHARTHSALLAGSGAHRVHQAQVSCRVDD